ncbi:MAG: SHOCT domain-containing protein [Bacilli bacterium]
MKTAKNALYYVAFSLLALFSLLAFFADTVRLTSYLSSPYTTVFSIIQIVDMAAAIALLVFSIIGLVAVSKKPLLNLVHKTFVCGIIFVCTNVVEIAITYIYVLLNASVFNSILLAVVMPILLIASLVCFSIALHKKNILQKRILGQIAFYLSAATIFFSMILSATAVFTIFDNLLIIAFFVLSAVVLALYPKIIDEAEKPVSNSPAEQLTMLKELYESGVITADEYEDKRKKYIDQL